MHKKDNFMQSPLPLASKIHFTVYKISPQESDVLIKEPVFLFRTVFFLLFKLQNGSLMLNTDKEVMHWNFTVMDNTVSRGNIFISWFSQKRGL